MQFFVRQKIFAFADSYNIVDAMGQPIFQVQAHLLSFGKQLELFDMMGYQLAHIQQRVMSIHSEYDIYRSGQLMAVVKKQLFTLFHPVFQVEGPAGFYQMQGDWVNWNYMISTNGQPVATISKQFSFFQDSYGVDIADWADVPFVLALVIVMDEVSHPDGDNSSFPF